MRVQLAVSFVVAVVAVPEVCRAAALTIAEVIANGASLQGQIVTVDASVTAQQLDYGGETTFTVTDTTGKRLTVFGKGTAPSANTAVQVTGVVGFKAPDDEFTWPPILHEAHWTTAP